MQDLVESNARLRDEIAEERAVGLVAARPLGGADEREVAAERRCREEVVIDVGDDRETVALLQPRQRRRDIGIEREAREGGEIALDERRTAGDAEMREGFGERCLADLLVGPIRLPVMRNVARLPISQKCLTSTLPAPLSRRIERKAS
jgi:hypothetical protein